VKNSAFNERYKFFKRSSTKKYEFRGKIPDFAILTITGDLLKRDVSPKKALNLLIGLRLNGRHGREMCIILESLLEETAALEKGGRFPLHWIFSVSPLLEHTSRPPGCASLDSLLVEIKTRCASRRDKIVAAGFRGAVHPLLTAEELDKELGWCWSHPAAAGFAELFAANPAAIMPEYPDPWRELGGAFYSRRGFKALGLPQDPARPYRFLRRAGNALASGALASGALASGALASGALASGALASGARSALFSYISLCAADPGEFSRCLRDLASRVPVREKFLFVVLDTASLASGALASGAPASGGFTPVIGRILEALDSRFAVKPASLADPELFETEPACDTLDYLPVRADPGRRRQWLQAEPLRRKKDRKDSDIRRILETLSADLPRHHSGEDAPAAPGQRTLDAAMTGEVVLAGERLDASFSNGRLVGISSGGRPLLCAGPAQSYLELDGTRYDYRTESAFSFQGPEEHGLRAVLTLRLPRTSSPEGESRLVVDCYFQESCPDLLLDFRLAYPELDERERITRIAPYEIPLLAAAAGESLAVQARFLDREETELSFPPAAAGEEKLRLLSGSEFIIGCNGKRLSLRFNGSPRIGLMEFRRSRRGARQLLCANLNGSYRAAGGKLYSGLEENFSFRMGLVS
jgi:hypothetical protein